MPIFWKCIDCDTKCRSADEVAEHFHDVEKLINEGKMQRSHNQFYKIQVQEYDWNNKKLVDV